MLNALLTMRYRWRGMRIVYIAPQNNPPHAPLSTSVRSEDAWHILYTALSVEDIITTTFTHRRTVKRNAQYTRVRIAHEG